MEWHVVKYLIFGNKLYAVENDAGCIYKYCNTLDRAIEVADEMNNKSAPTTKD